MVIMAFSLWTINRMHLIVIRMMYTCKLGLWPWAELLLCYSALLCQSVPLNTNALSQFPLIWTLCASFHLHPFVLVSRAAFGFLFSDKCGFSAERLLLNSRRDTVESVAGMAFLLAAERVQTGSYVSLDYIIGDTGISQGRYVKTCSISTS